MAETPTLAIGADLADDTQALHTITGVARLSDGSVVVADGGLSSTIRRFSADGTLISQMGRPGQGSGEYQFVTRIQSVGVDSVLIYDANLRRMTVFPLDGGEPSIFSLGSTQDLPAEGVRTVEPLGNGGAWFVRGMPRIFAADPGRILRDTIPLGLLDADLERFTLLRELPDVAFTTTELPTGQRGFGEVPFSPTVLHATWGSCVFVVSSDEPTISVVDGRGAQVASFDGPGSRRALSAGDFELRADALALRFSDPEVIALVRRTIEIQARLERLPYYNAMILDDEGLIWLQEHAPPLGAGRRWWVLSQEGELLAEVSTPRAMTVYAISRGSILGTVYGDFGEQVIVEFPFIERPVTEARPLAACQ